MFALRHVFTHWRVAAVVLPTTSLGTFRESSQLPRLGSSVGPPNYLLGPFVGPPNYLAWTVRGPPTDTSLGPFVGHCIGWLSAICCRRSIDRLLPSLLWVHICCHVHRVARGALIRCSIARWPLLDLVCTTQLRDRVAGGGDGSAVLRRQPGRVRGEGDAVLSGIATGPRILVFCVASERPAIESLRRQTALPANCG